jgi:AraC-like DNA-binding protein
MYTYFEKIPLSEKISFYAKELDLPQFDAPRHFHPEYELMCVKESSGKRFVGDNMSQYEAGDLVLLGPDLPHYWHNDDPNKTRVKAIVVQFRDDFPGDPFLQKLEMQELRRMLDRSNRGIHFSPKISDKIMPQLNHLIHLRGFERVILLLSILNQLSHDQSFELLASAGFVPETDLYDCEKINKIHQYILKSYRDNVKIDEAASLVNMTKSAFCHYFKKRTRKNFSRFVNEMRIGHASKLLVETDYSISEICYDSGFRNLSNFNRRFKEINEISPQEYRQQFRQELILPSKSFS